MKRLLIGPALALPLTLGLCHMKTTEVPKVPEVIPIDNFEQRFPVPPLNPPAVLPKEKPNVRRVHPPADSPERPRVHGRPRSPKLAERPHHPEAPVVKEKPDATSPTARPHVRHPAGPVGPLRAPAESRVGEAVPDQTLPAQQGVICIFPFNMIPNCTPGVP